MINDVYKTLSAVNFKGKTEKKNGLTYVSWATAWGKLKECYPEAFSTVYEDQRGLNYFTDGLTCYVKVGVTVEGLEHIEYLPVMDYKNKSIPASEVTSMDVNKAIQRALTKAIARHGLGLYVYQGEDIPEERLYCEECGKEIMAYGNTQPKTIANASLKKFGLQLCTRCATIYAKKQELGIEDGGIANSDQDEEYKGVIKVKNV